MQQKSANKNKDKEKEPDQAEQDYHINFFKNEEMTMKQREEVEMKMRTDKDYFNKLPYDLTSKFVGDLNSDKNTPWYLRKREDLIKLEEMRLKQKKEGKEFNRNNIQLRQQQRQDDIQKMQKESTQSNPLGKAISNFMLK